MAIPLFRFEQSVSQLHYRAVEAVQICPQAGHAKTCRDDGDRPERHLVYRCHICRLELVFDEASYKLVRDCQDWQVNGQRAGFVCNYTNKKELNKKCPWFFRH